jgi:protein-S-isoprenylcysteine O-methyltransferase Ste14
MSLEGRFAMPPIWLTLTPLSLLFWIAYAVMVVPELLGALVQREYAAAQKRDRGSERILIAGIVGSQILALNLTFAKVTAPIGADQPAFLAAGAVIMLLGVALRWYAIRVLGRFFTRNVAIRQDHEIIRAGPYRYIRHPSYSGYLLAALGLGIAMDNWLALGILLVMNAAAFGYRIHVEESALVAAFGQDYVAYQQTTRRILPLIY